MPKEEIIPTNCPFCQSEVRKIPAGVSKRTGKPYKEFWACENRSCNYVYHSDNAKDKPQTTVGGDKGEYYNKDQIMMEEFGNLTKGLREIYKVLVEIRDKLK